MGKQNGNVVFLGTSAHLTGFADEGVGRWRRRTSLDREQWLSSPAMASCRDAATLFGAASTIAGCLWRQLPAGMRRLGDGGAFNRLVAVCRGLVEEDCDELGRRLALLGDVDGLRGLDLSADSSGPHRVIKNGELRMEKRQFDEVDGGGYRLVGIDALFREMDLALGDCAGRKAGKFAVARRLSPSAVLDEEAVLAGMGDMWEVRSVSSEQVAVSSSEGAPSAVPGVGAPSTLLRAGSGKTSGALRPEPAYPSVLSRSALPQRRVRVWVHAVKVLPLEWVEGMGTFVPSDDVMPFSDGFVTSWDQNFQDCSAVVCSQGSSRTQDSGWKSEYRIEGKDWMQGGMESGTYVVFTAIEVAEKRGRHWVRLPWCSKMRISDIIENAELRIENEELAVSKEQLAVSAARLVGVPVQRMEESDDRAGTAKWDFVGDDILGMGCGVGIEYKLALWRVVKLMDEVMWGARAGP